MKTTTLFNNCLTFDQLQAYALNKSSRQESAETYKHISTCEMCACAVNGFTAIPFSFSDVDAIHDQINVKINATHTSPLTFAQVTFVIFTLAGIFGFYYFADSFSGNKTKMYSDGKMNAVLSPVPAINLPVASEENKSGEIPGLEKKRVIFNKPFSRNKFAVEPIRSISATLPEQPINKKDIVNPEIFNADVIYIYDLKVTKYSELYFNQKRTTFEMKGYTPSYKENKNGSTNLVESDITQIYTADRVLKKGLEYFNRGKYSKAIAEFQMLLDLNPDDINSLFYSGVSFYQIGKYNLSAKNLGLVLENDNNVFHPEAKWNLALTDLKLGDKIKAKELLNEIVSEKGFYSKKAAEELKGL